MPFNELFGGQVLLPSDLSYLSLVISADVDLNWPLEQQIGGSNVVADIIDLAATAPGLNVDMPDARVVSQGTSVLFNNVGAQTVSVRNQGGGVLVSLVSGTTWMLYLVDNTTANGVWRTFQFGASVSVTNAAALAGAGLKAITTTLNARIVTSSKAATPYNVVDGDRATSLVWTGGVGTFNLAAAGTVGADWFCYIRNSGSGDLTVTPPAGTIDGAVSKTYPAGVSSIVVCDGVNYYTLGFGSGSGSGGGFDFLAINVAGSGDYILAGAELNRVGYRFTGVLTGNRNIVVPGSTDEYWVDNQTTGPFSLFVKTVAQVPGIEVLQNNRNILYCDGANVLAAESATVSFPIPVAQGGTGAITAAAARTNLGAGVTGALMFAAATQAAAQTVLGIELTAANSWTNFNTSSFNDPSWELNETDAAVNNRRWAWRAAGEQMQLGVWNDARGAFVAAITVDRTLNVIDNINLVTPLLQAQGIHNGTAPTGTNNYIASGTYTPTLTNTSNISGSTSAVCSWMRVGNIVTVSGRVTATTSAGTTLSQLDISLPIASNLTISAQAAGAASVREQATNNCIAGTLDGNIATDRMNLLWKSVAPDTNTITFSFSYVVL